MRPRRTFRWQKIIKMVSENRIGPTSLNNNNDGLGDVLGGQKQDFLAKVWTTKPKWHEKGCHRTNHISYTNYWQVLRIQARFRR